MHINDAYGRLRGAYLFSEVGARVAAHQARDPKARIISLGIGDVGGPLAPAVIQALHEAVDEMGRIEGFHGYGPEQGYEFLRLAIARHEYAARGLDISPDEIFVSDGAKQDVGNFQELFSPDALIAVTDPVYPVYVDSNVMAGRAGEWTGESFDRIIYLPCTGENGFVPPLPPQAVLHTAQTALIRPPDCIYLCYPNNPTGTVLTREELARWVDYARRNEALILYDSAYEAFIQEPDIPHSIYEIPGAESVAVEFRSYSKTAGFTGLRCAYTVVPHGVRGRDSSGRSASLHALWKRRQSTKYNGCPYIVQRAAAATHEPEAKAQIRARLDAYMANAARILDKLKDCGLTAVGGVNAPYVWVQTPEGLSAWEFFDRLLERAGIVCTPGEGFGPSGKGYVRLTAFASDEDTLEALERMPEAL